jgi:hypothetical protein
VPSPRTILLGLILLLAGCQPLDRARLPGAPFELEVTPASVVEGGSFTLALVPTGAGEPGAGPVDLYVSFVRDASRVGGYLDPSGRWTADRVRYQRLDPAQPAPVVITFRGVRPFGQYSFRAQFVRPETSPSRKHYVFAPLVVAVGISPAPAPGDRNALVLGALGILSAGAVVLVTLLPRDRRA